MTYTEKELDQFLHGISLSLLSKKSAQHWRYDEETAKEIEWLEALERKVRADKADRKTENSSEKPNNCEYAENPSGDVWECGCFLDTYCEHQIYDRNPDGTINIVECGYEPKDEPQKWEAPPKVEHKGIVTSCVSVPVWAVVDEPKAERSSE